VAATLAAAGGDIAMIVDRDGVICDMALSNDEMARDGASAWLDRRWADTVTLESRHKVDELLRDALKDGRTQWREINQLTPTHNSMMVRYLALDTGHEGRVIAIGRDDRATSAMQRRLLEAQQAMEHDYSRLRDAEVRYRLLFQESGEAVFVVDSASRKIVEANPAAERLMSETGAKLTGEPFAKLFDAVSQEEATALLSVAQSASRTGGAPIRLSKNGRDLVASASLFRQGGATQCLVRLSQADKVHESETPGFDVHAVLERMPDAFVITDDALKILMVNTAFLDLVRIPTKEQALGQSLNQYLGRASSDRNILIDSLRAHGALRNFGTVLRSYFDQQEDVEVSAVSAPDGSETRYGFTIRNVRRGSGERGTGRPEIGRSVEQLTELVGRMKLKELVRETTDIVERLCIEAALELTKNNRAYAAEVLGLSRQSLYSKLHRFGLANIADGDD
jgi:transcriptional regulator PpsR